MDKDKKAINDKHRTVSETDAIENSFKRGYEQGRATERVKAIDEYNAKIKECCSVIGSCDFEDLDRIAKQLKEKK